MPSFKIFIFLHLEFWFQNLTSKLAKVRSVKHFSMYGLVEILSEQVAKRNLLCHCQATPAFKAICFLLFDRR